MIRVLFVAGFNPDGLSASDDGSLYSTAGCTGDCSLENFGNNIFGLLDETLRRRTRRAL
jgi:hypothetical protein